MTPKRSSLQNHWSIAAHEPLSLAAKPLLAGILNCTPDSFSDGGQFFNVEQAIEHGLLMIDQGADLIDIGGESTRPGSQRIDALEQIRRVQPVIRGLRAKSNAPISIDTTRSQVALAAINAGANIINDVSGGQEDANIFSLAATTGAGLILMHRLRAPDQDQYSHQYTIAPVYQDVVDDVLAHLMQITECAIRVGVRPEQIIIDPGFGFGKDVQQNFLLLHRLHEITATQFPVMVSLSRKSFLGAACAVTQPSERLPATLAAAVLASQAHAAILRVHDVAQHHQLRQILAACAAC